VLNSKNYQDSKKSEKRLTILSDSEKKIIYDLPKFSSLERKHYFDLEKIEEEIVNEKLNRGIRHNSVEIYGLS